MAITAGPGDGSCGIGERQGQVRGQKQHSARVIEDVAALHRDRAHGPETRVFIETERRRVVGERKQALAKLIGTD